ncbi:MULTISPECIES: DEAD/DEAH box helicase [unclassified Pseudomonas]|uniref:DEAD/DEAH box helicase n=1 Tax=unclassified Pseudomonas TaxID=196821 RepID=UPI000A1E754E|nr:MULTISPECIES: ATP-binding domain-containing protein [unclassified Pseudomonas]
MAVDILVTTERLQEDPLGRDLIDSLKNSENAISASSSTLYYDFPVYSDYDGADHKPDILVLSRSCGILAIRVITEIQADRDSTSSLLAVDDSLNQFCSILIGRLLKSKILRKSRAQLSLSVTPVVFCDSSLAEKIFDSSDSEVVSSIDSLKELIQDLEEDLLDPEAYDEARSVIEGAKALTRSNKRLVENPEMQRAASALAELESEIANFDQKQRSAALITINGPQRIRGLAGSGKTIILAMKAAHLHMNRPNDKILLTFYTKSLKSSIKNLVTKFYRHYKEVDPDWNNIHILHGWGGSNTRGAYSDACLRAGRTPLTFSTARSGAPNGIDPFEFACQDLMLKGDIEEYYDHILIDEGQDFPAAFYELSFRLAKGDRDKKNIVWAYDDLQNILKVRMRSPAELFGIDNDGEPRISLERAAKGLPFKFTNDTVLSKCYRNQREVLITAHALGFGVYSNIVQLLESADHWKDVGYEVVSQNYHANEKIEVVRPVENSPVSLGGEELPELIEYYNAESLNDETEWVAANIADFLEQGLNPEDIIIVALDDRHMKGYFRELSSKLADMGVASNNIHADPYSDPPFMIPGKITLSTIYRAKGNEAAVVFVIGVDAISLKTRGDRNKLFTAFTRTKAWLRVSGMQGSTGQIIQEMSEAERNFPALRFTMPDLSKLDMIQRDLSQRSVKAKKLRAEYLERLRREGLSEEDADLDYDDE